VRRCVALGLVLLCLPVAVAAAKTRTGTDGDDTLVGGARADVLVGYAGHDGLYGGGGPDRLLGGAGWDHLYGGNGNDILDGGPASTEWPNGEFDRRERLIGGAGDDVLRSHIGAAVLDDGWGSNRFDSRDPLTQCHVNLRARSLASGGPRCIDWVLAGSGDDFVQARDGNADEIQCGGGRDTAIVDALDSVSSCETVRRR
jgi:RTX calcium-binding nonapeptide repeat (4 copies)